MADKKCDRGKYLFLSSYLRCREAKMLTAEKAERLLDAADFSEAAKQLVDLGYEDMSGMSVPELSEALNRRRIAVFDDLTKLLPDKEIADIFRIKYDYHNAKVLIKAEAMGLQRDELLLSCGRLAPEKLKSCYEEENYVFCPPLLAKAMADAKRTLNRSENPQLAELELDRACFAELSSIAGTLGSRFVSGYVELLIDSTNLKTAVRCLRMGKSAEFMRGALLPGGSVNPEKLALANSADALLSAFAVTKLKSAAEKGGEAIKGGRLTAFELACDNAVTAYLKDAKLVSFGEAPALAYLAAAENELTAVRMILTGRKAGIAPDTIRERLRDMYV